VTQDQAVALNASELYEEDLKWEELDDVAESVSGGLMLCQW